MKPGDLRHVITIYSAGTVTESDYGGRTTTPSAYASNVWALVEPVSGMEYWRGMKVEADVTHVIHLRHMTSVTDAVLPSMTVSFDSRTFYVKSVINVREADWWLRLNCVEQVT